MGFIPFAALPGAGITATLPWFNVQQYGADPTGAKDSTAAFVKAYAAAAATLSSGAPGGIVTMGPGAYVLEAGQCIASDVRIGLQGPASNMCQVNAYGSGDVFYHYAASFPTGSHEGNVGPRISGFTVDGSNLSAGAAYAFHQQDICATEYNDVQWQNFTGANQGGWHGTGNIGWSERLLFLKARASNCTTHWNFDGTTDPSGGTSFDYMRALDLYCNIFPGQVGVMLQGFAQLDQAEFKYSYNCNAQASGAAQTALVIGPTDPSTEKSRIINALLDVRGEKDGTGSLCYDLHIGAWAQLTGTGVLVGAGMDAGAINSGSVFIAGYVNTPAFPASHALFTTPGGGASAFYGGANSFAAFTGEFVNTPGAKGLTMLDQAAGSSTVRSTLWSGGGNPNGVYFSNETGDFLVQQDGTANGTLWQAQGNDTSVWAPVVAAAVASGTATMTAGSVAVANTSITASSVIRLSNVTPGGAVGALSYALTAGTGFTIHSSSGTDTSKVYYEVVSY